MPARAPQRSKNMSFKGPGAALEAIFSRPLRVFYFKQHDSFSETPIARRRSLLGPLKRCQQGPLTLGSKKRVSLSGALPGLESSFFRSLKVTHFKMTSFLRRPYWPCSREKVTSGAGPLKRYQQRPLRKVWGGYVLLYQQEESPNFSKNI